MTIPNLLLGAFNVVIVLAALAIIVAFLFEPLQPVLRRALSLISKPLVWIYQALRWPLRLEAEGPRRRYLLFGAAMAAALAGSLLAPSPAWMIFGVASLLVPLAVITGWEQNEARREDIIKGHDRTNPDTLQDLRDEAIVAGLTLFPAFAFILTRMAPQFDGFVGDDGATLFRWMLFVVDQFLHSLIFDLLEVGDWPGLSGITIDDNPDAAHTLLEKTTVLFVRSTFALLFIGTVVRMLQIRQTTQTAVDNFELDPELALRLGRRASTPLRHHLRGAAERASDPAPAPASEITELLMETARSYEYPAATRALRALAALDHAPALALAQQKMVTYLADRKKWSYGGSVLDIVPESALLAHADHPDIVATLARYKAAGVREDPALHVRVAREQGSLGEHLRLSRELVADDVLATVTTFTRLLEAYVDRTGDLPGEAAGNWFSLPYDVFDDGYASPFADPRVRAAVARIARATASAQSKWQVSFDRFLARGLERERDIGVIAEILDSMRVSGAYAGAMKHPIAARYGADAEVDALLRRFVVLSGHLSVATPELIRDLLDETDLEVVRNAALLLDHGSDRSFAALAVARVPHDDDIVTGRLLSYLEFCADPAVIEPLAKLLRDPASEPNLRRRIIGVLAAIPGEASSRHLLWTLDRELGRATEQAAYALAARGDAEATPLLVRRAASPAADLDRGVFIECLGKLRAKEAVEPLKTMLAEALDDEPIVTGRRAYDLVVALVAIGDRSARPLVLRWREDEAFQARRQDLGRSAEQDEFDAQLSQYCTGED